jgi:hypothetical protein
VELFGILVDFVPKVLDTQNFLDEEASSLDLKRSLRVSNSPKSSPQSKMVGRYGLKWKRWCFPFLLFPKSSRGAKAP